MDTADFPYYQPPFLEYNPVQSSVIPFVAQDLNIVVAFPAASGKTVLAECAFAYHLSFENTKVVYVCPYRSLSEEKLRAWMGSPHFSKFPISISTGERVVSREDFQAGRLAIVTSESFDSKTRNDGYRAWLKSLTCVVFDEAHVMGERTGAIESAIMRLTELNPTARVILLSATMGNSMEVARWLKSLNGKQTKCFVSSWRPTKIETLLHVVEDEHESKVEKAVELASASHGKTIVFVHSKTTGADVCKRLRQAGVRTAFHNASVPRRVREKIESMFASASSGLDVLVSTSTLGAGVNLS